MSQEHLGQYFNRKELDQKLSGLKQSLPENDDFTTMCYSPIPPSDPVVQPYVCPCCGQKTIHQANNQSPLANLNKIRSSTYELRKLGISIQLEEKFFCSRCRKEVPEELSWRISIDGKSRFVPVQEWYFDLEILHFFLSGQGSLDDIFSLIYSKNSEKLQRLEELLDRRHA